MSVESNNQARFDRTTHTPLETVQNYIARFFPKETDALVRLSLNEDGHPFCFNHIDLFHEMIGFPFKDEDRDELRMGYVTLSAYYFLLDAVIDNHLHNESDALYLSHFFSMAWHSFVTVAQRIRPDSLDELGTTFFKFISLNAQAVQNEAIFQQTPLIVNEEEEYESIVGRLNTFLLLYHILTLLTGQPSEPKVTKILSDLLFYLQLGDDLGDWREDAQAKHWTSFLRLCFNHTGTPMSEEEIELAIFLDGLYEIRAAKIINGMEDLLCQLRDLPSLVSQHLQIFIFAHQEKLMNTLSEIVALKYQHGFIEGHSQDDKAIY